MLTFCDLLLSCLFVCLSVFVQFFDLKSMSAWRHWQGDCEDLTL